MLLVAILFLLGALALLVGSILFIIGSFRASFLWGCLVFLIPLVVGIAASFLGLVQYDWWWMANLALQLPSLVFLFMHWDKAKNGFLLIVCGIIFYVAAFFTMTGEIKQQVGALMVQRSGQPLPPALADLLGVKSAAAAAKPGTAGASDPKPGLPDASGNPAAKPGSDSIGTAAGALDTEAQVLAVVAELNDRAAKLRARKEALKGSADQPAVAALAEEIRVFNERLKVVTAREVELKMIAAPTPTPTPGPTIPPTVVIPPSTPAASPAPKKK
jgi:hypothetical protein